MSRHISDFPPPQDAPGARISESPIDHALTLLLAGEIDAAMRWAAAILERAPSPGALLVTCRLLDQMGRTRAAIEGLRLGVQQAIDRGDLPLAVAAIDDLRTLGVNVAEHLDAVASVFCRGSSRLYRGDAPPSLPPAPFNDFVQPLSPFLAGPALASKATQIVQDTRHRYDETMGGDLPRVMPLPLFSALPRAALRDLLAEFHAVTVPAGHHVIVEGDEGSEAYVVVRGEVEISRRAAHGDNKFTLALARLGGGAFFGEMALLSVMPSPASATTTRPSILLAAKREALVEVATNRPEIAGQLAVHCRRNSLANLGWTSQVVAAVPPDDRATLVERLEMRVFEKGDLLVRSGEDSSGLHLIVSGEIAIVAREWGEHVLLATLGAGDTVGEMELVLCRQPFADAVATRPTAALFLSRDEYSSLIQDHPAILHGLYAIAVQRQAETSFALKSGSAVVADDWLLDASSIDAPMDAPPKVEPNEPSSRRPSGETARALPAIAAAGARTEASRSDVLVEKEPEPPVRRTLPPPPPRLTAPPPSSLSPTMASIHAPSMIPEPPRVAPWMGMATVTGLAAVAASVVTVLTLRSTQPAGAPSVGAASLPPAAVQTLPIQQATPNPPPSTTAPVAAAPSAPPAAVPTAAPLTTAVPSASAARATPVAAPPTVRTPAAGATGPKTMTASATPVAPRRAASEPAARADSSPTPPPSSGTVDDEFGGRQ